MKSGIFWATASKNWVSMPGPPFFRSAWISMSMSSNSDLLLIERRSWMSDTTPSATPAPSVPDLALCFSRCLASRASWQQKAMDFQKGRCLTSAFTWISISDSMSSHSCSLIWAKIWCGGLSRMVISSNSWPSAMAMPFTARSMGRSRPCSMRMRLRAWAFSMWKCSSLSTHSPNSSSCISLLCSSRCCSRSLLSTSRSSRRFFTAWISCTFDWILSAWCSFEVFLYSPAAWRYSFFFFHVNFSVSV
mmetsp:Transcript_56606/g.148900  ORF Transcript_56606/g.148900 Transcript_56606/m.148900 type:complete len:247 (-) Transcript_56606:198-938(-)